MCGQHACGVALDARTQGTAGRWCEGPVANAPVLFKCQLDARDLRLEIFEKHGRLDRRVRDLRQQVARRIGRRLISLRDTDESQAIQGCLCWQLGCGKLRRQGPDPGYWQGLRISEINVNYASISLVSGNTVHAGAVPGVISCTREKEAGRKTEN